LEKIILSIEKNAGLPMCSLVTREDAEYAHSIIKRICAEVGPGCPGSPQEQARAMIVKNELEKVTDNVTIENFSFAPNAFLGWFKLGMILLIISVIFFYLSLLDIAPLVFAILACSVATFIFLMMELEFLRSREFIDWLYKKYESTNVVGTIRPKEREEIKRILIYSGHHDSSLQFTWFRYLKSGCYLAIGIIVIAVILLLVSTAIRLLSVALSISDEWNVSFFTVLTWTIFPAGIVFGIFFTERGKNGGRVPGAVDNLSGVSLAVAVARVLKANPGIHPPQTEVRFISFGAEEASVRGSRAYVRQHLTELKYHDVVCLNFESIAHPEITIYKSDLNNSLKFDPAIVTAVAEAAIQAKVPHNIKPFPFGGAATDAAPFVKADLKAISLCALKFPHQMLAFYHQEFDTPDKVEIDALQNALQIAIEFMRGFNREDKT